MTRLPHPIPYQGSKRRLASRILRLFPARDFKTMYEPFAGSAAVTLAAARESIAEGFVIGDALDPLAGIWRCVLANPTGLADEYEQIWSGQIDEGSRGHFNRIRAEFNNDPDPAKLLYLLARCVKNAPRFSRSGFSQSADHRRKGMRPEKMRKEICGAHDVLDGRCLVISADAWTALAGAGSDDIVYLDPPWQGTTEGADKRYFSGFARATLEQMLADLNRREVPWILSYDGRSGDRTYGDPLDAGLVGHRLGLHAGRSSQATLVGQDSLTVESLYLSPGLDLTMPSQAELFAA